MFGRTIKSDSVGIELKAFAKSDIPQLLKYINKPETNKWLCIDTSYTNETEEAWYDDLLVNPKKFIWGIYINGEIIGTASVININFMTRSAEIALMIGNNKYYKRGIGTEVTKCLCDFCFNELNSECIYYIVSEANIPSIKIAEKNGFKESGFIPHYFYRDGKYYSAIIKYKLRYEAEEPTEEPTEAIEEAVAPTETE